MIQTKRQRGNIQRSVLDVLRGLLHRFRADRGAIITTSGSSPGTIDAAIEPGPAPISLNHRKKLVQLLIEQGIGVRKQPIELWKLDTTAFSEGAADIEGEES